VTGSRASGRDWLVVVLLAFGLVVTLTWPTVPRLATHGRIDSNDGELSIWNIGWIDHALLTQPGRLFDANIFHPHKGTLAYSELNLVPGLFGLPAYAVSRNSIAAQNFAVVVALVLSVVLMWALVRRLTGSSGAGLVAFCPFVLAHTAHTQLLMVFGFPLVFLAFHRLADAPGYRRAAALGAALSCAGLACAYYGIFVGLALGLVCLALARPGPRYWIALAVSLLAAGVLTLPVVVPYLRARGATGIARTFGRDEVQGYSATLATYATSPSIAHQVFNQGSAESVFPGFVLLVLAAVGVVAGVRSALAWERRLTWTYLVLALVALWASFGPNLGLWSALSAVVPMMSMLRAPVRLGIVVVFALAILAGFGVRHLAARRPWLSWVLVAAVALELFVPWPLRAAPPVPRAYTLLAERPRAAVVELLFNYKRTEFFAHTRFMFNSTYHWQPLLNGYSDLIPPDFEQVALLMTQFPDPASFAMLRERGVRYVVVHLNDYNTAARETLLARFPPYEKFMRRLTSDQDVWLYEILQYPH
jgi:hypothetical protein